MREETGERFDRLINEKEISTWRDEPAGGSAVPGFQERGRINRGHIATVYRRDDPPLFRESGKRVTVNRIHGERRCMYVCMCVYVCIYIYIYVSVRV